MIFYFTGTGNSLYAAKAVAQKGERLIDIAQARLKGEHTYIVPTGESVGFFFPVYCYTVNDAVLDFVRSLDLIGADFVYAVITCGASTGGAAGMLACELEKRGIALSRAFSLVMPDNAMLWYNIDSAEKAAQTLKKSDEKLRVISYLVSRRKSRKVKGGTLSKLARPMYRLMSSTKGFRVTDKCTGCGLCARTCPDRAIELLSDRPVWIKPSCLKCAGCINRCPSKAIEYGKATAGRNRYVNPLLRE